MCFNTRMKLLEKLRPVAAVLAASALLSAPGNGAPPPNAAEFEKHTVTDGGASLGYRLFKPAKVDAGQRYPIILFLHGAGERGDNNEAQLLHGLRMFSSPEMQAKHPAFILAPQCPAGKKWSEVDWSLLKSALPEKPSRSMQLAMKALDSVVATLPVDPQRIYLAGISMGGYGTWDAAARWPGKFAAAIPVCGGGDDLQAARLKNLPVWCFHGDKDTVVPVVRSRDMVQAIQAAGGSPKYTEYPGVGHNCWDRAYAEPALYEWLFSQHRAP
jgi:predicted peptidase